jgi:hypothetical protein
MPEYRIPFQISLEGELLMSADSPAAAFQMARRWLQANENKSTMRMLMEQSVGKTRVDRQGITLHEPDHIPGSDDRDMSHENTPGFGTSVTRYLEED